MRCLECGKGINEGVSLFRQNEKGQIGIWACAAHNKVPIDSQVKEILDAMEINYENKTSQPIWTPR